MTNARTYTSYGNAKPWESRGYQDRCRVPGPILPMDEPGFFARLFGVK